MLEPHSLYTRLMTAPNAPENAAFPASVFTTRLAQDQLNKKLRASVNCVAVRLRFPALILMNLHCCCNMCGLSVDA
jgi:hypothetical protein